MFNHLSTMIRKIKEKRPLILNITNHVTMELVANGLLSLGASPIMTTALPEIRDLVKIANAVVINIGTLNDEFIQLCEAACETANELGVPLTLDPVGAGASQYRTKTCLNFLDRYQFSLIRGNASEVMALCSSLHNTKGVDSNMAPLEVIVPAKSFSLHHDVILAISGKTDAIIAGEQVELLERGCALMPHVTGSGCLLTSVISAFQAVHRDYYAAACAAVTFYGVCGELAAAKASGPGSFKSYFLDALSKFPEHYDYETE
jgi:hydroxyethylthiazole kinase